MLGYPCVVHVWDGGPGMLQMLLEAKSTYRNQCDSARHSLHMLLMLEKDF